MSEETIVNQDVKKPTETSNNDTVTADNQVEKKTDNFVPQARFDEVIAKQNKLKDQIAQYEEAEKLKVKIKNIEKFQAKSVVVDSNISSLGVINIVISI